MKRLLYLATLSLVASLLFAPTAGAAVHLCSENPDQQSAQAALNQDPSLASTLDPDGDGTACEDFFGTDQQPQTQQPQAPAQPQPQAPTMTDLPSTGGPALLLPAAGLLLGAGLFGMRMVRRRS